MLKMIKKFVEGVNTIIVRSEKEFEKLKEVLRPCGVSLVYPYEKWKELARINRHENPNILIFENQPYRGVTFYKRIKDSVDWYGVKPYEASSLISN